MRLVRRTWAWIRTLTAMVVVGVATVAVLGGLTGGLGVALVRALLLGR